MVLIFLYKIRNDLRELKNYYYKRKTTANINFGCSWHTYRSQAAIVAQLKKLFLSYYKFQHGKKALSVALSSTGTSVNSILDRQMAEVVVQRDQQGLKLLAANDSKILPKYEIFLCVSVGTRCKL
jgi:hypothetical protein